MTSDFQIIVRNTAGAKVAEVTDHLELGYALRVNAPGLATFTLDGDHPLVDQLADKYQVEIWRRNTLMGVPWYCDFYGLYRAGMSGFTNADRFAAWAPGQLAMLGWRTVAFPAGVVGRSQFSALPAETIAKAMVGYNATAAGDAGAGDTAGGNRARAATLAGFDIAVETDLGRGNVVNWYCANDNLLESLQKLALIAGGDFALVKTGPAAWEFRFYAGQLGTDRSATVLFSLARGNMAEPQLKLDRQAERTVAIVGGGGEGVLRTYEVVEGAAFSTDNDIELFVDARDLGTDTAGMDARGAVKLAGLLAHQEFSYNVLQTPGCFYGRHYFLGDLVQGAYRSAAAVQKLTGITVSSTPDEPEVVGVELSNV